MVDIEAIVHARLKEGRDYRQFRSLVLRSIGSDDQKKRKGRGKGKGKVKQAASVAPGTKPRILSAVTFRCHEKGPAEGIVEVIAFATRGEVRRQGNGRILGAVLKNVVSEKGFKSLMVSAGHWIQPFWVRWQIEVTKFKENVPVIHI
jgi:hypothetical protein